LALIASLRHPSITRIAVDDQARGLAIFGLSQLLGTSGFLVTYLAAVVTGAAQYHARQQVEHFFEGMAWLAQIVLFVMLGLLVTGHFLRMGSAARSPSARPCRPATAFDFPSRLARGRARVDGGEVWGSISAGIVGGEALSLL
jgi:hypothetical protein